MRHAGAVHLHQHAPGQPGGEVDILRGQQRILAAAFLHQRGDARGRVVAVELHQQAGRQQGAALAGLHLRHRAQIAERGIQAELGQRVFRAQPARRAVQLGISAGERADGMATHRRGQKTTHGLGEHMPAVTAVTGEYLVAAVAGYRHGGVPAGEPADAVSRHRRRIAEWLAENAPLRARRLDHVHRGGALVVLHRAVALRHQHRIGSFVFGALEADGEGVERGGAQPRGGGHDRAGIDAARQEGAERHVGDQPLRRGGA
jgi:hypothetical protein